MNSGMSTVSDKAFQVLKGNFTRLARLGEMKKLLTYLDSDRYKTLHAQLTVKRQLDLHDYLHAAKSACTKHQKKQKPIPRYTQRGWRAWDAERIAWLVALDRKYQGAAHPDKEIAREMGISVGGARMARWRYIGKRGHKPFETYATVMREAA